MRTRRLPPSILHAKDVPLDNIPASFVEHFWARVDVDVTTGCWNWTGTISASGYGILTVPGGRYNFQAHRVSWVMANDRQVPRSRVLDHQCFNRRCVNPDHLLVSDHYANLYRVDPAKIRETSDHCVNGHPWTDENTYVSPRGQRNCRECNRIAKRKWLTGRRWDGKRWVLPERLAVPA